MIQNREVHRRRLSSSPEMPPCKLTVAAEVHPLPEENGKHQKLDTSHITVRKKVRSTPFNYDSIEIDTSINSKKNNRLRKEVNMPRSLHQIFKMEEKSSTRDVTTETGQLTKDAEVKLPEIQDTNNIPQLGVSKKPQIENNSNIPRLPVSKRLFSSGSSTDEEIPVKVIRRKQKATRSNKENRSKYKKIKSNRTKSKPVMAAHQLDIVVRDHVRDGYESLHSEDEVFKISKIKKKVTKRAPRKYTERPLHFKTPPLKSPASSGVVSSLPDLEVEKEVPYTFRLTKGLTDSDDSMFKLNAPYLVEPPAQQFEAVNSIMEPSNTQTIPTKPIETLNPVVEANNTQSTDPFSQETRKIIWFNTTDLHKEINLEPSKEVEKANFQTSAKIIKSNQEGNMRIIESDPKENTTIIDEQLVTSTIYNEENGNGAIGQNIEFNNHKTNMKHVGNADIMSWIATVYANNIKIHLDKVVVLDDPAADTYYDILMKESHLIGKYFKNTNVDYNI